MHAALGEPLPPPLPTRHIRGLLPRHARWGLCHALVSLRLLHSQLKYPRNLLLQLEFINIDLKDQHVENQAIEVWANNSGLSALYVQN